MTKEDKYKAAIIGLGNIAFFYDKNVEGRGFPPLSHAGAYCSDPRTEIVSGCSPDDEHRSAFEEKYAARTYMDVNEMLSTDKPDIVSICSPTEYHSEHLLECFKANIPMIWLEKPPAASIVELDHLIEQHKLSKSTVLVNYTRRFVESYYRLKDIFNKNSLGEAVALNLTYSKGLLINGSHILDAVFCVVGDEVKTELGYVFANYNTENPSFVFRLESGLPVYVTGYDVPYHCRDIVLVCKNGRATITQEGMQCIYEERVEQELFPGFYRLHDSKNNPLEPAGIDQAIPNALSELIYSYEKGVNPKSNLITARNAQYIMDKVYEKVRNV